MERMTDEEAGEAADRILQATGDGFAVLEALARGDLPVGWDETLAGLAWVQGEFRGSPPRWTGILVEDADVADLARLRGLVAREGGAVSHDVRDLALGVRAAFDKTSHRRAA